MEETIDALRERGNEYYRSKNYVEAIGCYDEIMKLDTEIDRPKILGNRSAAYIALGKWKMAEEDARRALELDFGNEKFMFRLASSLLEQAEDTKKIESLKVCDDALLLHPESTALKKLKIKIQKQLVQRKLSSHEVSIDDENVDDMMAEKKKKNRMDRWGFLNTRRANKTGIFGSGDGTDMFCEPCVDNGPKNPFEKEGAMIIETIDGASYTDVEYTMLTHVKDIVKSIQRGDLTNAGLLKNHYLTGKFKNLCDKEYFQRTLFPGFSKEAAQSMPQNMRELLLWNQLTLDLTKVARNAAKVLVSVKEKGQKRGDIMDAESERTLTPQIAQEALALELEAAVHQLSKQISKVMAKVHLPIASPTAERAQWDQLDDEVWPCILESDKKLGVQEQYVGSAWSDIIIKDIVRFCRKEPMDDMPIPGKEKSKGATFTTDISRQAGEGEINLPTVPVRMAWLESQYDAYPALSEVIKCIEGLPFELNLKQESAMGLKEPARGCLALLHHLPFSEQPERLDNRLGETDSGLRLSCYYYLIPQDEATDSDQRCKKISMRHRLRPDTSRDGGTGAPHIPQELHELYIENDSLVMLQSAEVIHERKCASFEYYIIALYIHGSVNGSE